MKILITGAAGYIGSYLTQFLSHFPSHEVILLCRELPEYFESWRKRFNIIECDVVNSSDLQRKVTDSIDWVIHTAALNNVECVQDPQAGLTVNALGTRNVLELARLRKCKSVVYFSTLQVYGRELQSRITVNSPVCCEDDYALTHYASELYCQMYALNHKMNVSVLRPSNIFGCPIHPFIDRWTLVPACFCLSIYKQGEIRLKSSGRQNRDFISLQHVAQSVSQVIKRNPQGFQIFNLSSGELFSILEIAQIAQSVAAQELSREIKVFCESDLPKEGGSFFVENNLLGGYNKKELKEALSTEVGKTLQMLSGRVYESFRTS